MTTKLLKTIKLFLALSSAVIFFILLLSGDGEFEVNFLGLYMGLYNFCFFLGLIAVLILAVINYFSANEKFNIATNILALLVVVSFVIKLLTGAGWDYNSIPHACVSFGFLLPVIMLITIFMLDRKFNFKIK